MDSERFKYIEFRQTRTHLASGKSIVIIPAYMWGDCCYVIAMVS